MNEPREIKLDDSGLRILWDDGHSSYYPHRYLRAECRCAGCVEEMSGRRLVTLENIREDVQALDWDTVGRYALQFLWTDGHTTGIYPFDLLRQVCQCEQCVKR